MVFSHRMAALAAVVAIPLGIAATSYALTDSPESPKVPPKVELDSGSPSVTPSKKPTPSDEVVSRPPVSNDPSAPGDDDDDDGAGGGADDDGPGDDG
ncbi:small secreted hydrophilic protein [Streptomyces sp. HC44]|uniref:Small secreted hydrophilic protein n=1 Tax=Streptomyces scabichelini TaxID=2711217 RepID=A0A6G4VHC6_9ACTN|nr:small secreted hydrophilic protein [Streptomyces scabichelini]NGO13285.1 small secreted hydrophilic protein [Streptomyces scabichelini]